MAGTASQQAWSASSQTYDFKVFLGKDEIGRQRFDVSTEGERTQVRVDAQFTVKFLYITVYTYRHTNVETWEGACLREIRAETDDNGESFFVNGIFRNGQLQVQTQAGNWIGEGCLKTFAYWNPEWMTGKRLLNSQTGEHQPASHSCGGRRDDPRAGSPDANHTPPHRYGQVHDRSLVHLKRPMGRAPLHHSERRYPSLYAPVRTPCHLYMPSLFMPVVLLALAACSIPPPIRTATAVDLERFMGDWYVIANIPTFIETNAYNAMESYRLAEDGTVATTFTFREGGFEGATQDLPSNRLYPRYAIECRLGYAVHLADQGRLSHPLRG